MAIYPTSRGFTRPALIPGILLAIAMILGVVLETGGYALIVRYAASILALIMLVFAYQARSYWAYLPLAAIAVVWNPIWHVTLPDLAALVAYALTAIIGVAAGILTKVPEGGRTPSAAAAKRPGPGEGGGPSR
jgi:hypothetical protein